MSILGPRGTRKVDVRGAHRSVPPRETVLRLTPFFGELGITRIANVTRLDRVGVPTVLVMRPNSRSLSVSRGNGLDLDTARASGIMESVEQFHAEHVDRPLKFGSYAELSRVHRLVDVTRLPRSVRAFDAHRALLWVEAEALGTPGRAWVPYELVHLNLTLPLPPGTGFFQLGSNGLASGNTAAEANAQAVFELIERDAAALFRRLSPDERAARHLDLDSVDDPGALELLARYRRADLAVAVWDITSDVGVAAFRVALVEERAGPYRPVGAVSGFGCHNDRGVALCRALSEAAQSRLGQITGSRDDICAPEQESPSEVADGSIDPVEPQRRFADVPHATFATFEEDLEWLRRRLATAGLDEVWLVDLSRAGLPVSVVRAIVPGLEGSADVAGYVPGARAGAVGGSA